MTDLNSIEYYKSREQRERKLAAAATDPGISAIHMQMAKHYAEVIADYREWIDRDPGKQTAPDHIQLRIVS